MVFRGFFGGNTAWAPSTTSTVHLESAHLTNIVRGGKKKVKNLHLDLPQKVDQFCNIWNYWLLRGQNTQLLWRWGEIWSFPKYLQYWKIVTFYLSQKGVKKGQQGSKKVSNFWPPSSWHRRLELGKKLFCDVFFHLKNKYCNIKFVWLAFD